MRRRSALHLWAGLRAAIVTTALTGFTVTACAWTYPPADKLGPADKPHPTPAQMAALLDGPPVWSIEAPFSLRLMPASVNAGGAVRITCHVPASYGPGTVRVALENITSYTRQIAYSQNELLAESIPCGIWIATCSIHTRRGSEFRQQALESRGDCE